MQLSHELLPVLVAAVHSAGVAAGAAAAASVVLANNQPPLQFLALDKVTPASLDMLVAVGGTVLHTVSRGNDTALLRDVVPVALVARASTGNPLFVAGAISVPLPLLSKASGSLTWASTTG